MSLLSDMGIPPGDGLLGEIIEQDDKVREEMDDDYPCCGHCGGGVDWELCTAIGCEDGYIDVYEEDPLWYSPGDMEACDMCEGKGGWWICLNSTCSGSGSHTVAGAEA